MKNSEGKYKTGSCVFAKSIPDEALIIRRYVDKMYYCKLADDTDPTDLVYFEKELMSLQEKKELE